MRAVRDDESVRGELGRLLRCHLRAPADNDAAIDPPAWRATLGCPVVPGQNDFTGAIREFLAVAVRAALPGHTLAVEY